MSRRVATARRESPPSTLEDDWAAPRSAWLAHPGAPAAAPAAGPAAGVARAMARPSSIAEYSAATRYSDAGKGVSPSPVCSTPPVCSPPPASWADAPRRSRAALSASACSGDAEATW